MKDVLLSWLHSGRMIGQQCAALPILTKADGAVVVALVTSRETKRWVLPKGWAKGKLPPHEMAAKEAREEAGLIGDVEPRVIGRYRYRKKLHAFASVLCEVTVFPLDVRAQLLSWREKDERTVAFFAPQEAASLVAEDELATLLRELPGCSLGPSGRIVTEP